MNFYWADSPMSWLRYMTLLTFRRQNPEWEMGLHSSPVTERGRWDQEASDEDYRGEDWRGRLAEIGVLESSWDAPIGATPQHCGDLCRWAVLSGGGMFADMDIVWLKPMPEIAGDALSCANGILKLGMASGARGGLFGEVLKLALEHFDSAVYQSAGVEVLYELAFGSKLRCVSDAAGHDTLGMLKASLIPMGWVHPLEPHAIPNTACPDCVGLHWYGGLEFSADASRRMTEHNYKTFTGAIPDALARGTA